MMMGFYNVPGGQYSRLLYTNIESTGPLLLQVLQEFLRAVTIV
jgi:hypothetical protein